VNGAAPGTWQLSFSVPESLGPRFAERVWLQLGAVAVPLPLPLHVDPGSPSPPDEHPPPPADGELLMERKLRSSELAVEEAQRRVVEAEKVVQELMRWISELEASLAAAREAPLHLRARLAERERAHRAAEQRAHAERERRLELLDELGERERAHQRPPAIAALEMRIAELEEEPAERTGD